MEKKSLSQQTAERLYTMIVVERRFGPGDKLPNELEWSAELRVSRATLRGGDPYAGRPGRAGGPQGKGHLCVGAGGGDWRFRLLRTGSGQGPAPGPL
ncbi:MAG: hypothetical protein ACLSAF_08935 [Intestinimonas sp.]